MDQARAASEAYRNVTNDLNLKHRFRTGNIFPFLQQDLRLGHLFNRR